MRIVIQRVSAASVNVGGDCVGRVDGPGLMVLVGVRRGDSADAARRLAAKTASLRIFEDESGVMNRSLVDVGGSVLAVSQFTLLAQTLRGNRPSYIEAAPREEAEPLYELFCDELERLTGRPTARGRFGADMKVALVNDGPVTIVIDSDQWK
jgi:D-tyrosyl-tRNA(Tyr) deacylase